MYIDRNGDYVWNLGADQILTPEEENAIKKIAAIYKKAVKRHDETKRKDDMRYKKSRAEWRARYFYRKPATHAQDMARKYASKRARGISKKPAFKQVPWNENQKKGFQRYIRERDNRK